jgi:palmitoyl transferase
MRFSHSAFRQVRLARASVGLAMACGLAAPARSGPMAELGGMFSYKFHCLGTALRSGQTDIFVTGYAWHMPWAYAEETRSRLNETTWGGGIGRSMVDDDGDRQGVFFVALRDSHRSPQYMLSYSWQRYLKPERPMSFGWGYMAFVFAREDVNGYSPIPALLPCVSFRGRHWEVLGMYVPRVNADIKGDVLFFYLRLNR